MDDIKRNNENVNSDVLIKKLKEDIALLKEKHQQDLINQKDYYESIIATMPGHVYWQDTNNTYLGCNDLQAKNAGLASRHDIVGKKLSDMLGAEQAKVLDNINEEIIRTGKPYVSEEYAVMKNGEAIYLSHKAPLRNRQGDIVGLLGISIDITERKQMEERLLKTTQEALEANRVKTEFIMNMSHDIRTPFTGILGSAFILQRNASTAEQQELIGYITESAEQLLKFVNEILDEICCDYEHNQQLSLFNIEDLLKTIKQMMVATINHKNLNLHIEYPTNAPAHIIGNKLFIKQILLNLVSNAIKFTEKGTVTLSASFSQREANDVTLIIQVRDTGIGIPKDKQQVIFEKFTRLTPSYSSDYAGSGLGLWKTKQLLTQLNGTIDVDSQESQGSIFTCKIPLRISTGIDNSTQSATTDKKSKNIPEYTDHPVKNSSTPTLRFLLVEDDIIATNVIKYMLTEYFNCQLDIASTGKVGIDLTNRHIYDLVILDIGLPDQSGFNVAKQIYQHSAHNQQSPIIGLTAHQPADWVHEENQQFFKAIYNKPLSYEICAQIASITNISLSKDKKD